MRSCGRRSVCRTRRERNRRLRCAGRSSAAGAVSPVPRWCSSRSPSVRASRSSSPVANRADDAVKPELFAGGLSWSSCSSLARRGDGSDAGPALWPRPHDAWAVSGLVLGPPPRLRRRRAVRRRQHRQGRARPVSMRGLGSAAQCPAALPKHWASPHADQSTANTPVGIHDDHYRHASLGD